MKERHFLNIQNKLIGLIITFFFTFSILSSCNSQTKEIVYDFKSETMKNNIHKIRLTNVEIEYLQTGNEHNTTILFVHGFGASFEIFEKQHEYFSKEYRVISINLRGHGNSILLNKYDEKEFEFAKMSEDIIELLDTLNIEHVHYIGFSMGGNVGYELLNTHPKRLQSFITYGTPAQMKTSRFSVAMMKFSFKLMSPTTIGKQTKKYGQTENAKEKIVSVMSQISKSTLIGVITHLSNYNYLEIIKNSSIPALIIKGEKDKENNLLGSTITEFEKRGNFQLNEIQGAGHFTNLDNPNLFNIIIHDFLNRIN